MAYELDWFLARPGLFLYNRAAATPIRCDIAPVAGQLVQWVLEGRQFVYGAGVLRQWGRFHGCCFWRTSILRNTFSRFAGGKTSLDTV